MIRKKFNPGDRVVYPHPTAVRGTVIKMVLQPHHSGVCSGQIYYPLVILDNAEEVLDEQDAFWLESDYDHTFTHTLGA